MNLIFRNPPNFRLSSELWGDALPENIVTLLENVVHNFYVNFEKHKIPLKTVFIQNSRSKTPVKEVPEIYKEEYCDFIYLTTQGNHWYQYSYQFAHELCHHVIQCDYFCQNDRFGWIEEAFCELASICTVRQMSKQWRYAPPYLVWEDFADVLELECEKIISADENRIDKAFYLWLSDNIEYLYTDRYKRLENRILSIHLMPLFEQHPQLWETTQYLKCIAVTNEMNLYDFINSWKSYLPNHLKERFNDIEDLMLGN